MCTVITVSSIRPGNGRVCYTAPEHVWACLHQPSSTHTGKFSSQGPFLSCYLLVGQSVWSGPNGIQYVEIPRLAKIELEQTPVSFWWLSNEWVKWMFAAKWMKGIQSQTQTQTPFSQVNGLNECLVPTAEREPRASSRWASRRKRNKLEQYICICICVCVCICLCVCICVCICICLCICICISS